MAREPFTVRLPEETRRDIESYADDQGTTGPEAARELLRKGLNQNRDSPMGIFLGYSAATAMVGFIYVAGFVLLFDAPYGREALGLFFVAVWLLAAWGAYESGQRGISVREVVGRVMPGR